MLTAMKRYLILLAAVALLAACNKDNDEVQPTQSTTPKRLANLTSISYSRFLEYNYESGQYELSSTSGSKNSMTIRWSTTGLLTGLGYDGIADDLMTVEYDGTKIKSITVAAIAMGSNEQVTYTCTYTDDNLTGIYTAYSRGWDMTTLTYNPNNELIATRRESSDGDTWESTIVWENGNVIHESMVYTYSHSSESHTTTYDYLYDNMTSAYTGMEAFSLIGSNHYMLSHNNVLRIIESRSSSYDSPEGSRIDTTVYTYTYDGDWPITQSTQSRSTTNYMRYTDGSGATAPQTFTISTSMNLPDINDRYYVYGGGDYEAGRQVVLKAESYITYQGVDRQFMCWNDGVTDNPRTFTVTGDAQFIAVYENSNNR